jgi:hypothetical protein
VLADALNHAAPQIGLGRLAISVRQVRRWESAAPPWPHADSQKVLLRVLGGTMEELGFTPPHGIGGVQASVATSPPRSMGSGPLAAVAPSDMVQPSSVAVDYATITAAYRRLYATAAPTYMHNVLQEHTRMGAHLLPETNRTTRQSLALALAESLLLLGRIEFFDLQRPRDANRSYVLALQAAGEADDALLGSAILAHNAFIPGWVKNLDGAIEQTKAARVYARRAPASAEFLAWLDSVEAECLTISGHFGQALRLLNHAEDVLASPDDHESPEWFTWFSPVRLAAFKGNTQLRAGKLPQARETLTQSLNAASPADEKQTTVILGDLAAVEAAAGNPEKACEYAERALDQLGRTWYATGMDRIKEVSKALQAHADLECVQTLDDRLWSWQTTLNSLQH